MPPSIIRRTYFQVDIHSLYTILRLKLPYGSHPSDRLWPGNEVSFVAASFNYSVGM